MTETSSDKISNYDQAHFWDERSYDYSSKSLTTHNSDDELNALKAHVGKLNYMYGLACLGAADGLREPCEILKWWQGWKKPWPEEVMINDISHMMLKHSCNNINDNFDMSSSSLYFIAQPIEKLNFNPIIAKRVPLTFFGTYNYKYLIPSFQKYYENKEILGNFFSIFDVKFEKGRLEKNLKLRLNINDNNDEILKKLIEEVEMDENFYGFWLCTDLNFSSTYFNSKILYKLVQEIFAEQSVEVEEVGNRYIVTTIKDKQRDSNYLITSLNNVLGNILLDEQVNALKNIKKIFYKQFVL
jgi:hypothetical protein